MTSIPVPASRSTLNANLMCMASMVVWAAALPAADFLIGNVPPVALTAMRMGLAGLSLLPVWWLAEGRGALRGANWIKGIGVGALFSLGALFLVLAQARTDAVTVAVIAALLPVIGMGIEVVLDGRRITTVLVLGIGLSLAGGLLAYAAKLDEFGLGFGALAALLSNLTYAAGSRLSVTAFPAMTPLGRSALTLCGAGIAATLTLGLQTATVGSGEWGVFGWQQAAALAMFSICGMSLCQILWIASIDKLGLGVSSLHINAASFYVMFFAWLLGSPWNWVQAAGALIVGLGVLVAQGMIPIGSRRAGT
ncbi:MAG: DMT family transporter [Paracoccaceae bacterium]